MKKLNIKTIAFAGVLIAMNLVLARVLAINIGPPCGLRLAQRPFSWRDFGLALRWAESAA